MKVYYVIYQLTNLVNGKIYIGCHMTKNLDDGYMGSGKRLACAKKKYGIENFKKEILSFHETAEEMLAEEKRLVTEEFLNRKDVYNLTCGGRGSWFATNINYPKALRTKNGKRTGAKNLRTYWSKLTKEEKDKIYKPWIASQRRDTMLGKHHTQETKLKMSLAIKTKKLHVGEKNSQHGTKWIHSLTLRCSKKIKNCDQLPEGWNFGRKMFRNDWNSWKK